MTHVMAGAHILRLVSEGACNPYDVDRFRHQLVAFLVAAFEAPEPKDS